MNEWRVLLLFWRRPLREVVHECVMNKSRFVKNLPKHSESYHSTPMLRLNPDRRQRRLRMHLDGTLQDANHSVTSVCCKLFLPFLESAKMKMKPCQQCWTEYLSVCSQRVHAEQENAWDDRLIDSSGGSGAFAEFHKPLETRQNLAKVPEPAPCGYTRNFSMFLAQFRQHLYWP